MTIRIESGTWIHIYTLTFNKAIIHIYTCDNQLEKPLEKQNCVCLQEELEGTLNSFQRPHVCTLKRVLF